MEALISPLSARLFYLEARNKFDLNETLSLDIGDSSEQIVSRSSFKDFCCT